MMRPKCWMLTLALLGLVGLSLAPAHAADAKKKAKKGVPQVTYDDDIKPIFRAKCGGCHNTDKKTAGLDLLSYTAMMQGGNSGAAITKGNAAFSYLWMVVNHETQPYMPLNSPKLDQKKLDLIKEWISIGAPENKGSKTMKKKKVDLSLSGVPLGKPSGPPAMPKDLSLRPVRHTSSLNAITALAASPWAPLVAVGGFQQIALYDMETMKLCGVLPFPEGVPQVLRFSRNGSLLLCAGGKGAYLGTCAIYDVATGKRITTIGSETDTILAADISPDQQFVAMSGCAKQVKVFSIKTGELAYKLQKHTNWVYDIEFSPDSVLLATADRNGGLMLWEATTGNEYLVLKGHKAAINSISWRSDSNLLVSGDDQGKVYLWNIQSGKPIRTWTAHGGGTKSIEFTRDGRILTCGADKQTKLWGIDGKAQRTFKAFDDLALDAAYVAEGGLVVAGSWLGEVRVWNAADGKLVGTLTPNPPTLTMRVDAAKAALAKAQKTLVPIKKKVASAQADAKQVKKAVAGAESQLSKALSAQDAADEKVAALESGHAATTAKRDQVLATTEKLQAAIDALEPAIAKLRAARKESGAKKLTAPLTALEEALKAETTELAAQKRTVAAFNATLKASQAKLADQKAAAAQATKAIAAANKKVSSLKTNLGKKAAALKSAQKLLQEKSVPVAAAKERLEHWQHELALAEKEKGTPLPKDATASAEPLSSGKTE